MCDMKGVTMLYRKVIDWLLDYENFKYGEYAGMVFSVLNIVTLIIVPFSEIPPLALVNCIALAVLSPFLFVGKFRFDKVLKLSKEFDSNKRYLGLLGKMMRHDFKSGVDTYLPRLKEKFDRGDANAERFLELTIYHMATTYKASESLLQLAQRSEIEYKLENVKSKLEMLLDRMEYGGKVDLSGVDVFATMNCPLFMDAVDNIIRNGITHNASELPLVMLETFSGVDSVLGLGTYLSIKDNGKGLTKSQFDYYVSQNSNTIKLGTFIISEILRIHNFKFDVRKLKQGTEFIIKLD